MSRRAAVLGASGHAKVVIATLQAAGWEVVSAWDDSEERWGGDVLGVPVRGPVARAGEAGAEGYVVAVGDNEDRRRIAQALDLPWISVVHPAAVVHPSVALGPGAVVFAGAVIQPDAAVGRHAIVNTAASVDHDCRLGAFVHVAPGCRLAGGVTVGEGAFLGIGTSVLPGIAVGAWSVIGAGSAVIADLGSRVTAYGTPARVRRRDGAPPDPPGGADG